MCLILNLVFWSPSPPDQNSFSELTVVFIFSDLYRFQGPVPARSRERLYILSPHPPYVNPFFSIFFTFFEVFSKHEHSFPFFLLTCVVSICFQLILIYIVRFCFFPSDFPSPVICSSPRHSIFIESDAPFSPLRSVTVCRLRRHEK